MFDTYYQQDIFYEVQRFYYPAYNTGTPGWTSDGGTFLGLRAVRWVNQALYSGIFSSFYIRGLSSNADYDISHRRSAENSQPSGSVFRVFNDEKFAKQFLDGQFRLSTLARCRTLEDAIRRDEEEGRHFHSITHTDHRDPKNRELTRLLGAPPGSEIRNSVAIHSLVDALILCVARDYDDETHKFGEFCIEITRAKTFFRRLAIHLEKTGVPLAQSIYRHIDYGDSTFVNSEASGRVLGFTKAERFAKEQEIRMFFALYNTPAPYKPLDVKCPELSKLVREITFVEAFKRRGEALNNESVTPKRPGYSTALKAKFVPGVLEGFPTFVDWPYQTAWQFIWNGR